MKNKLFLLTALLFLGLAVAYGQKTGKKIQLTGTVTDINHKPVSGAPIFVDNNSTGKVTNNKGIYKVKVSPDAQLISVMSFSGKITEAVINGQTKVDLSLPINIMADSNVQPDKRGNEDINIGYGTVKQRDLTTSVGKVEGRNNKYAVFKTIYELLSVQPGVKVVGTSIKIQNASSFMSGTEPLIIVDGVPVSSVEGIQPINVRSVQILKGASTSIYGSRGANGVILIDLLGAKDLKK